MATEGWALSEGGGVFGMICSLGMKCGKEVGLERLSN